MTWKKCPVCDNNALRISDGVCEYCTYPNVSPGGTKHDQGKPPMGLLPGLALVEVAKVLEFGAKKYSPNNWRTVKPGSRYLDAALRHLHAHADGEDNDPESGLSHLAHAACCVLFMLDLVPNGDPCRHTS